jgi:hypothetical protein
MRIVYRLPIRCNSSCKEMFLPEILLFAAREEVLKCMWSITFVEVEISTESFRVVFWIWTCSYYVDSLGNDRSWITLTVTIEGNVSVECKLKCYVYASMQEEKRWYTQILAVLASSVFNYVVIVSVINLSRKKITHCHQCPSHHHLGVATSTALVFPQD